MKKIYLSRKNSAGARGATLVEAALAMMILAIVVIGSAAFIIYGSGQIAIYHDKMIALEIANNRLEELKSFGYDKVKANMPMPENYNLRYAKKQPNDIEEKNKAWVLNAGNLNLDSINPAETVSINGMNMPIITTLQYEDKSGIQTGSYDYIMAVVSIGYRVDRNERVELKTYLGPYR